MSAGIIVGYDGSECSKHALSVGLDVAKVYGEKLILAFAYDVNPVAGGELTDYRNALREIGVTRLTEGETLVENSGVEIEGVIVEESPAKALVDLAIERDARVIVVGTRGERAWHRALIGSTPHKLLQLSDRAVLVVPMPSE
jgi:nucleotide-binding universal stress UspA family protein